MRKILILGLAALTSTTFAAPFEYEKQIGHHEYDHTELSRGMHFAPVEKSDLVPSLTRWTIGADVDGIALNDYRGTIIESGPTRISLYEVMRDSPEGIAYRDYHEKYPVDTDWAAVAREFRAQRERDIAARAAPLDGDS